MPPTPILHPFLFNNHRIEINIPDKVIKKDNYKKGVADFIAPYWAKL